MVSRPTPRAARGSDGRSSQVLEGEQRSGHEELVSSGRQKAAADVLAPYENTVLEEVEPIECGEATA